MSAPDLSTFSASSLGQPARAAFAITPHDTNFLPALTLGIYVGGIGNIAILDSEDGVPIFVGVVVGSIIPVRAQKVFATGTTATNLLGLR